MQGEVVEDAPLNNRCKPRKGCSVIASQKISAICNKICPCPFTEKIVFLVEKRDLVGFLVERNLARQEDKEERKREEILERLYFSSS